MKKKKKERLLKHFSASLIGNILSGKGIVRAGYRNKMDFNAGSSFNKLLYIKVFSK